MVAWLGLAFGASRTRGGPLDPAPEPDPKWAEDGVRAALETRDLSLVPLALRTLADLNLGPGKWWGRGDQKLLADHPEVREALEYQERQHPLLYPDEVWERWKRDGYDANSDDCVAIKRWREMSNHREVPEMVMRESGQRDLLPPPGARAEHWYYCIGVWDEADVDALLAQWSSLRTTAVFGSVQPAMRSYAGTKLLDLLVSSPPERRARVIEALGVLGYPDEKVIAQLDLATADPRLRVAALAALARLMKFARPVRLKEERLIAWRRATNNPEDAASFIGHSPLLQAELTGQLERASDCTPLRELARGLLPTPKVIAMLIAKLTSKDERARQCGELVSGQLVRQAPELQAPFIAAGRTTQAGPYRVDGLLQLIYAGAEDQIIDELVAYYRQAPPIDYEEVSRISEALGDRKVGPAVASVLRPVLLSYMKAQAPGWRDDFIGRALLNVGPISPLEALDLLERTHGNDANLRVSDINQLRFWAIAASGGEPAVVHAARWFAARSRQKALRDPAEAQAAINATLKVLDEMKPAKVGVSSLNAPPALPDVDSSALSLLRLLLDDTQWTTAQEPFLRSLLEVLPDTPQMADIRAAVQLRLAQLRPAAAPEPPLATRIGRWAVTVFGTHFLIWLALLVTIYPRSRTLQVAMLFNPLGRAVTGLGYTQLLVLVSPWLRRRLFHPLVDGGSDTEVVSYDAASFYDQIRVAPIAPRKNPQAPVELLPPIAWTELARLEGVVVIEGASGLGKTHVLKALLERSRKAGRTCLFVRAAECNAGVLKEIEDRLALEHSSGFVRSMIYRGAIELFLDGLNEAQPSGVAEIAQFCERALYARIFITTQPMSWPCPRRARQFRLLPLEPSELEAFLMAQWPAVRTPPPAGEDDEPARLAYQARVQAFLAERTAPRDLAVLQNRIDLAFVAHLLARAEVPNIHSLRKQVVDDAARAYEAASPGGAFPLAELGAAAVRVLETGNPVIDPKGLDPAVLAQLAERKLLLHRGAAAWLFRHDTITCYFAAQGVFAPLVTAAAVDPRAVTDAHLASPRFVGVYLQLAESLPLAAAENLATSLRDHGRDSNDRTLEIAYQDQLDRRTA